MTKSKAELLGTFMFNLITDLEVYESAVETVRNNPNYFVNKPDLGHEFAEVYNAVAAARTEKENFPGLNLVDIIEEHGDNLLLCEFLFHVYDDNSITEPELKQLCDNWESMIIFWDIDSVVNFSCFPAGEAIFGIEDIVPHANEPAVTDSAFKWLQVLISEDEPVAFFVQGHCVERLDIRLVVSESDYVPPSKEETDANNTGECETSLGVQRG